MTQPSRPTFSRDSLPTGPWRVYRSRTRVHARRVPGAFMWRRRDDTIVNVEDGWVLEHADGSIEVLEAGQFAATYEAIG